MSQIKSKPEWVALADRQPALRELVVFYNAADDWFSIGDLRQDGCFWMPTGNFSPGTPAPGLPRVPGRQVTHWQSLEGLSFMPDRQARFRRRVESWVANAGNDLGRRPRFGRSAVDTGRAAETTMAERK